MTDMSPVPSPLPSASNPWFGVSMGLIGLIVGYGLASGISGIPFGAPRGGQIVPTDAVPSAEPADIDDDTILGQENAPVTIIEFTDYQCPFCGRHFEQTFGQIKTEYVDTGKVRYVVRDFPLGFHPHAQKAAEATECASDQDKFWEMHDMLFSKQGDWSSQGDAIPTFKQYAQELGLNTNQFNTCLDNGDYVDEVQDDLAAGSDAGIDGTPGFWILGPDGQNKQISGAYPFDTFKAEFDAMLAN